ncbi:hypothetical protein BTVI_30436 [Pitangus sulphuratus]|nr:hypothetical protein BTVI_30436 [Pitangus sulphuratus]
MEDALVEKIEVPKGSYSLYVDSPLQNRLLAKCRTEDHLMHLPDRIMYKHKEKSKKPLNMLSMGSKQGKLEAIVQQESRDVVTITETRRDDSRDWSAAMDGYKLFRRDRQATPGVGTPNLHTPAVHRVLLSQINQHVSFSSTLLLIFWGDEFDPINRFQLWKYHFYNCPALERVILGKEE